MLAVSLSLSSASSLPAGCCTGAQHSTAPPVYKRRCNVAPPSNICLPAMQVRQHTTSTSRQTRAPIGSPNNVVRANSKYSTHACSFPCLPPAYAAARRRRSSSSRSSSSRPCCKRPGRRRAMAATDVYSSSRRRRRCVPRRRRQRRVAAAAVPGPHLRQRRRRCKKGRTRSHCCRRRRRRSPPPPPLRRRHHRRRLPAAGCSARCPAPASATSSALLSCCAPAPPRPARARGGPYVPSTPPPRPADLVPHKHTVCRFADGAFWLIPMWRGTLRKKQVQACRRFTWVPLLTSHPAENETKIYTPADPFRVSEPFPCGAETARPRPLSL
jgi:hypothetical protein